jgi:hypothetical protein
MPIEDIEEWRPVPRAPDHYEVSSFGRVRRFTGRVLSPGLAGRGYPFVILFADRQLPNAYIHQLVLEAFIGPRPTPRHQVNHIDGVKTNNHLSNLEWTTASENMRHAFAHGLIVSSHTGEHPGEAHHNARLTEADVRFIRGEGRAIDVDTLAAQFGVHRMHIYRIRRGERWKHLA